MPTINIEQYAPGQSLHSLLFRAAKGNHYRKPDSLMAALGIGPDYHIGTGDQAKLSTLLGSEVVGHLQRSQLTNHLRTHVAVCPTCLIDAPYHREVWRSHYLPICPDHHITLISRCPNCGSELRWSRLKDEITCQCGCSLAYAWRQIHLSPSQADLLKLIAAALTRSADYERHRKRARMPLFLKRLSPSRFLQFIAELHALVELEGSRRLELSPCTLKAFFRIEQFLCDWDTEYYEWMRSRLSWQRPDQYFFVPQASLDDGVKTWMAFLDSEPYLREFRIRLLRSLSPYRVIGFDDLYQSTPNWYPNVDPNQEYITVVDLSLQSGTDTEYVRALLHSMGIAIWSSDRPDHDVVFISDARALVKFLSDAFASIFDVSPGESSENELRP